MMQAPIPFTAKQKLTAVKREVAFRRTVYRRRVVDGRMSQSEMEREISVFEAIQRDYEQMEATERNGSDLFASGLPETSSFVSLGSAASSVVAGIRRQVEAEASRLSALVTDVDGSIRRLKAMEAECEHPMKETTR